MSNKKNNLRFRLWTAVTFVLLFGITTFFFSCAQPTTTPDGKAPAPTAAETKSEFPRLEFNDKGELKRPDPSVFREWVFVGTPFTPNELNNGKAPFPEFHNVYMHPEDYKYYRTNGKFQDGTMMMKELVSVGDKQASSGKGYFQGEYIGLEATVKDSKRFPDEPGNWAYFSWSTEDHKSLKEVSTAFPAASCNACHAQNAAFDFVFMQYYPVLRDANPNKTEKPAAEGAEKKTEGAETSAVKSDVPIGKDKLLPFVTSGKYKGFTKEAAIHPSAGPHENVRAFFNETLEKSMKAGATDHPLGSASVKEMYKDGKPFGWAVMVKTDKGKGGESWYWYEVAREEDSSEITKVVAEGNTAALCITCHAQGNDYVISKLK